MDCRILPLGDRAVLAEVAGIPEVLGLRDAMEPLLVGRGGAWAGVQDVVCAARTVMVICDEPGALGLALRALAASALPRELGAACESVEIPVSYDGPDLAEVALLTGLTEQEVINAHTGSIWTVAFGGFAPGFPYLVGGDPRLAVPRRSAPRTKVPAGAVGLAGEFSGIYPRESPGGWQLLGTTSAVLWDSGRTPPALLQPGMSVRFVLGDGAAPVVSPPAQVEEPARGLEVIRAGARTLIQDLGRPGSMDVGVTRTGAADRRSHALAARLLGQEPDRAGLEIMLGNVTLRARGDLTICLTGAPLPATVDGRAVAFAAPVRLRDGQMLELGVPQRGLRTYLAVRGGIDVSATLGSRATDTLSGLGPAQLTAGDILPVGPPPAEHPSVDVAVVPDLPEVVELTVLPGPRRDWFADPSSLLGQTWEVSGNSDRVGIRLSGEPLQRVPERIDAELPSEGMTRGCIQVPPDGQPVLFLSDHPVTGGYPVIAVVHSDDVDLAAQLRPGQQVQLRAQMLRS